MTRYRWLSSPWYQKVDFNDSSGAPSSNRTVGYVRKFAIHKIMAFALDGDRGSLYHAVELGWVRWPVDAAMRRQVGLDD